MAVSRKAHSWSLQRIKDCRELRSKWHVCPHGSLEAQRCMWKWGRKIGRIRGGRWLHGNSIFEIPQIIWRYELTVTWQCAWDLLKSGKILAKKKKRGHKFHPSQLAAPERENTSSLQWSDTVNMNHSPRQDPHSRGFVSHRSVSVIVLCVLFYFDWILVFVHFRENEVKWW